MRTEGALQQLIPQIGDDLEVRVVLGAADVTVVLGTWTVVDLAAVAPIVAAQHEADGRVEVPLHFARIKPELPEVVRILDAGAERVGAISDSGGAGVQHPRGRCQVLVPP